LFVSCTVFPKTIIVGSNQPVKSLKAAIAMAKDKDTILLLAGTYKVIAIELQNHGRSGQRDIPQTFEQDADDVAGLLKALEISKANFFGFSNGGTTAMQIAIRHPVIVDKLILVASAYSRDGFINGFFDGMKMATIDNMPVELKKAFLVKEGFVK